jgi:hypothetical protein
VVVSDAGGDCHAPQSFVNSGGAVSGWAVTFTGGQVSGAQPRLEVLAGDCTSGCLPSRIRLPTPKSFGYSLQPATEVDDDAHECSKRGRCDYSTGACECFSGFMGEDCSICAPRM